MSSEEQTLWRSTDNTWNSQDFSIHVLSTHGNNTMIISARCWFRFLFVNSSYSPRFPLWTCIHKMFSSVHIFWDEIHFCKWSFIKKGLLMLQLKHTIFKLVSIIQSWINIAKRFLETTTEYSQEMNKEYMVTTGPRSPIPKKKKKFWIWSSF